MKRVVGVLINNLLYVAFLITKQRVGLRSFGNTLFLLLGPNSLELMHNGTATNNNLIKIRFLTISLTACKD